MVAIHHKRWLCLATKILLAILVTLYVLYLLLGYFYLPGKLQSVAETTGSQALGRNVSAKAFSYNPFTLELTSTDFAIADEPGQPLLQWQQLRVNVGFWATLWHRHLVIQEIELKQPQTYIHQTAQGFNFDPIITRLSQPSEPTPQPTTEAPASFAFSVLMISIEQGDALYRDSSGTVAAEVHVDDLSIALKDMYIATGDDLLNPFSLNAALSNGGQLSLSGNYRLQPLLFDINLQAERVNLQEFADFLRNHINADLTRGTLAAKAKIRIASQPNNTGTAISLQQGSLELTDLALDDAIQQPPMLRAKLIAVRNIELDIVARRLQIGALEYRGIVLNQWQTQDGEFRYESLLAKTGSQSNQPPASSSNQADDPWALLIDQFILADSTVNFSDQQVTPPVDWQMSQLTLQAGPLHLTEPQPAALTASAVINQETTLTINGELTPAPLELDLAIKHTPLELSVFNPYMAQGLNAAITQGSIANNSSLKLTLQPELNIAIQANSEVQSLQLINSRDQSQLLALDKLTVDKIRFNIPGFNTQIDTIKVIKPAVNLTRDSTANWDLATHKPANLAPADIAAPSTNEPSHDTQTELQTAAPVIALQQLSIEQGELTFTDRLQSPHFVASINDLTVAVNDFSTESSNPADITVNALFNQHAPFELNGQFAANPNSLAIKGNLNRLELTPMSSYSGTYIGYKINNGTLNYDFDYRIDGSKLDGKNHILAKSFNLGDTVNSEQAINAPIKLGLALLRDLKGNIDLDLDINGDMQAPSFNITELISKTFGNILVKAAASPFTLLGSLVNSDDDLGSISFAPGSAVLDTRAKAKLQQLVEALNKKTAINLVVRGNADPQTDRTALQLQQLLTQLKHKDIAIDISTLATTHLDLTTQLADADFITTLEKHYQQHTGEKVSDQITALMQIQALDKSQARQQVAQQNITALAAKLELTTSQLEQLANIRAKAIGDYLFAQGLTRNRVTQTSAYASALTGITVALTVTPK
ncbi:DUF748 domain-containing protein [Gilvimarinus polysaccharolyticus]|uniref:DUF748 domain-containing protein n=1 Tax=Gilvimarinus polysaccharolyticus TaxID=863921 RepID=UPI00067370CC|nr:DUF748 domain-containing protein [Gilvimarinus polysaccharolyticus]